MIVGGKQPFYTRRGTAGHARGADQHRMAGGGDIRIFPNLSVLGKAMSMPRLGSVAIQ